MNDLERIISQVIQLQDKLLKSKEKDQINRFTLEQLADIAEDFVDNSPHIEVHSYKDEVIVSGVIPNILSPQDIAVKLEGGLLLHIECKWCKNDNFRSVGAVPLVFKKKIKLPFFIIPETLSVTYNKGILQMIAKKVTDASTVIAKVQFND